MRTATPISDEDLARISVIVSGDLTKYVPSLISRIAAQQIEAKQLAQQANRTIENLREGLNLLATRLDKERDQAYQQGKRDLLAELLAFEGEMRT